MLYSCWICVTPVAVVSLLSGNRVVHFERLWDIASQKPVIADKLAIFDPTDAPCTLQVRTQLSMKILLLKEVYGEGTESPQN